MEGNTGNSYKSPANKPSELEILQKENEEKTLKIQGLKRQIESVKLRLEKTNKQVPEEKKENLKNLSEKYNSMKEEYNALMAKKSAGSK